MLFSKLLFHRALQTKGSNASLRFKVVVQTVNDSPPELSLEEYLKFIDDDELVEITPKSIRIRKMILDEQKRRRANAEKLGKKKSA